MQDFPHHYIAAASARSSSNIEVTSPGIESLESAGPAEFGGPGDLWSPETLLVASVADCFVLGFRAVARASRLDWHALECDVIGILERVDKVTQFTKFDMRVVLEVPQGVSESKAVRMLEKAKKHCLITNSMTAETRLDARVEVVELAA